MCLYIFKKKQQRKENLIPMNIQITHIHNMNYDLPPMQSQVPNFSVTNKYSFQDIQHIARATSM